MAIRQHHPLRQSGVDLASRLVLLAGLDFDVLKAIASGCFLGFSRPLGYGNVVVKFWFAEVFPTSNAETVLNKFERFTLARHSMPMLVVRDQLVEEKPDLDFF